MSPSLAVQVVSFYFFPEIHSPTQSCSQGKIHCQFPQVVGWILSWRTLPKVLTDIGVSVPLLKSTAPGTRQYWIFSPCLYGPNSGSELTSFMTFLYEWHLGSPPLFFQVPLWFQHLSATCYRVSRVFRGRGTGVSSVHSFARSWEQWSSCLPEHPRELLGLQGWTWVVLVQTGGLCIRNKQGDRVRRVELAPRDRRIRSRGQEKALASKEHIVRNPDGRNMPGPWKSWQLSFDRLCSHTELH